MLPIRKQLCKKCLKKYRIYENTRRQKHRLKVKLSKKVPVDNLGIDTATK